MNEQTVEKMRTLKLFGMQRAFKMCMTTNHGQVYTPDELVSLLIEAEWDDRYNRKLERNIKSARFRYNADIEQIHYEGNRGIDKNLVKRLAECAFVKQHENVLICGSTGIGKSYLASAFGHQACSMGYKVAYEHCSKLFARLKIAKADGSYLREIARIEKMDVLILDDFGIQTLDAQSRAALMEIMEDRYGKSSIIITSQVPVAKWHEVIGEATIADAILDRIIHDAHRIELKGESLRKKAMKQMIK